MVERSFQAVDGDVQELNFGQPVVNIGSHPENDLKLTGNGVLPFHATLILRDGKYNLIRLAPEAIIRQGQNSLDSPSLILAEDQSVEIGEYSLSFRHNGSPTSIHVQVAHTQAKQNPSATSRGKPVNTSSSDVDNAIIVKASASLAEADVDQIVTYELEIANAGPIVASFFVAMRGLPDDWVEIRPTVVNLFENQRATVTVTVLAPRSPNSAAGRHAFEILVTSPNYPTNRSITPLSLSINPFYEFTLGPLNPREQNISWRKRVGGASLPINNKGNSAADFAVSSVDDENGCSFDFRLSDEVQLNRQATVNVKAGETILLPIAITPIKRPLIALQSKRYQYATTVQVAQQTTAPQIVSGSVTSHPLFGWWSIAISVALVMLALFFLLQPRISSFEVTAGKNIIELGDSTNLTWAVSPFATRLNISNLDKTISYGQTSQTITPAKSTTYELIAGNWLSGMFNIDQKKIQTVLVVPPSPLVNVFAVDSTSVARGKPIKIRWSVSQADKAILTIAGVVYELTPDKFSGEQSVVLDKDALVTMNAQNTSGSELRSYFVNVVEPSVTVNSFVVWVRPQTTASTGSTQPGLAAMPGEDLASLTATRPTRSLLFARSNGAPGFAAANADAFTERYVALIPDLSSDSKYRVEFYNPGRELAKGEQVMIEWNVDGTDSNSVQIAPFTDVLPNKGRQPFFPQESMNFVMTAQSGDEKKLFMLPVTVFDGLPPAAPKIDIFQASPLSMVGPSSVQFAWSVSGSWTRIQLANGKGTVADYLNPQGFKKVNVSASDTFILTAWNGKLSSAIPLNITVNPSLTAPGLAIKSIDTQTNRFLVGGKLPVTIEFKTIPTGKPFPTGQVIVTDGSAICNIPLPALSCNLIFTTSGTKTITASFAGDALYSQSTAAGFPQTVDVASSQVSLNPNFYFNTTVLASPIPIQTVTLDMSTGLRVIVEVRPKNTVLADNNGNISISMCNQDATGKIITNTCGFVGAAKVKVAPDASIAFSNPITGYGYADVTIPNFTAAGTRAMLIEYTHSTNSIDPANFSQPNIHINRAQLFAALPTCAAPDAFTSCSVGIVPGSTNNVVTFDLKIPNSGGGKDQLSSLMVRPASNAFKLSSTLAGATAGGWSCAVQEINATYKLGCNVTGLISGKTYTVTLDYNNTNPIAGTSIRNDYYFGTDPNLATSSISFQLQVLSSSRVVIGDLTGVKVGERIHISGPSTSPGLISIFDGSNTRIFPNPDPSHPSGSPSGNGLTLEEKTGKDIFGIDNGGGTGCSVNNTGSKITIISAISECSAYFKVPGSFTLVATYDGNVIYSPGVSGDTLVNVVKQDAIKATWNWLDSSSGQYTSAAFPSQWVKSDPLYVRVVLDGPASRFSAADTSFPPTALVNRKLLVTFDVGGTAFCILDSDPLVTDIGNGVYEVGIGQKAVGGASPGGAAPPTVTGIEFSIDCSNAPSSVVAINFSLAFSDKTTPKDSDSYAFDQLYTQGTNIKPVNKGTLVLSVKRQADSLEMASNANLTLAKLNFGEKYQVSMNAQSSVPAAYAYVVNYYYNYNTGVAGYTIPDLSVPQTAARNAVLAQYSSLVAQVDASTLSTAMGAANTCNSSVALQMTGISPAPDPNAYNSGEVWSWQFTGYTYVYDYSRGQYDLIANWARNTYGRLTFGLQNSSPCILQFDSAGSNTPVSAGSIVFKVNSADNFLQVNDTYAVTGGLDKQTPTMTIGGVGAVYAGFIGLDLPVDVILTPQVSGSTLPFGTSFTIGTDANCSALTSTVNAAASGATLNFKSPNAYAACNIPLVYNGNNYFYTAPTQNIPTLSFSKHSSAVTLSSLPFASGAFTGVSYPLTITVADADNPTHATPVPGGTLAVQVLDSSNAAISCAGNYTITGAGASCASSTYTLNLSSASAGFNISFNAASIAAGYKLQYSYSGDANFAAPSAGQSAAFNVTKHTSTLTLSTIPFTGGAFTNVAYTLSIAVDDADNPAHASPIPGGTIAIQVVNSANATVVCAGNYTITGLSCATDTYTLALTNGSTGNFTITFAPAMAATGYKLQYTYSGDGNFNAPAAAQSSAFAVTKHAASVALAAALPFGTGAGGAFSSVAYSLNLQISDADTPTHNTVPTGSIAFQVINAANTAVTCAGNYTVSVGTCTTDTYTLPLTGGATGSFNINFTPAMVSTGYRLRYTYTGDGNFTAPAASQSVVFDINKHASTVAFTTVLPFGTGNANAAVNGTAYNLTIHVADGDGHAALIAGGTVTILVNKTAGSWACSTDYTVSAGTCAAGVQTVTLDGSGNAAFSITFKASAISAGNTFTITYIPATGSNFTGSNSNSAAFDVK